MTYWEVHHFTLCDGWINTWTVHDEAGNSEPEKFATEKEALDALNEFFEIEDLYGNTGGYSRDEFRLVAFNDDGKMLTEDEVMFLARHEFLSRLLFTPKVTP